ncbi:hypothetical protein GCM10010383_75040 [Streptomyces lomondensis]|uniref:Uncharacterized protein n=1 Tax=Streptomyces lomondensis TaxID=68229 RepID=A0ABQ2XTI9_9ACTN|nr:hypothetical protein GCM10010383_75040 [Streptomyces lomondensis]
MDVLQSPTGDVTSTGVAHGGLPPYHRGSAILPSRKDASIESAGRFRPAMLQVRRRKDRETLIESGWSTF